MGTWMLELLYLDTFNHVKVIGENPTRTVPRDCNDELFEWMQVQQA